MRKLFYAMSLALTMALVWTGCSTDGDPTIDKFTVTFNSNGGSAVSSVEVNKNAKITKPTNPTKENLIFVDWFKEASFTTAWNFSTDVVTSATTLYAKWTTVEYTVSFNTNGGSAVAPVTVAKGSALVAPLPPSKAGAAFEGWYKDAVLTNAYNMTSPVNANITLYAKWTTVSTTALETLIDQASDVESSNYTGASYSAMLDKLNAARDVLHNEASTPAQILAVYNELQAAISALVALPSREAVAIRISEPSLVDGVFYVTPGKYFSMVAYAVDANGDLATNDNVTFAYPAELTAWADGAIDASSGGDLVFTPKATLTAGKTVVVTITSVAKPGISKTVTLKVAAVGALKAQFLAAVNALPAPELVSYEHIPAINKLYPLFEQLSYEERSEEAVEIAIDKMWELEYALEDLPFRMDFSFVGNVCTFKNVDYYDEEEDETMVVTYIANGAFPQGTYTTAWEHDYDVYYYQSRITLKNGVVTTEERTANNPNGTGASEWSLDQNSEEEGTYTFTGTQAAGGRLFITWVYKEDVPTPGPAASSFAKRSSGVAKSPVGIFKR